MACGIQTAPLPNCVYGFTDVEIHRITVHVREPRIYSLVAQLFVENSKSDIGIAEKISQPSAKDLSGSSTASHSHPLCEHSRDCLFLREVGPLGTEM